jgi:lipopolysaccharide transport system ATP-binding protein
MSDTVIRVEHLAKRYRLGVREKQPQGWGQSLQSMVGSPFKYLRSALREPEPDEVYWALKDVSFEIKQGDVVGIIGRNGAGKSTLLKILSRITEPTAGFAEIRGRVGSLLEVGTGFHPDLTGRENTYLNGTILGMTKREIDRRFDEIVSFAEIEKFIDTPVKFYSSGMYTRLAFAVAAHLESEILIVDEVLAVGDIQFQKKCLSKMNDVSTKEGRTVLFVSHNLATIKHLCNMSILIEKGVIKSQGEINQVMRCYEQSVFISEGIGSPPGVLYEMPQSSESDFWISKIEMLDSENQAKQSLSTWDYVRFRIHYSAKESIQNGAGVLCVNTIDNTKLLHCSTRPDQGVSMPIYKGSHYFDCTFNRWPLSAGKYLLQAGLAVPMREWLYQTHDLIHLNTESADIFNSGMPPDTSRYIVAAAYEMTLSEAKK